MSADRQRIAKLLIENRSYEDGFWPWLANGQPASKKEANKFILGCILDYQIPAEVAWENARRLADDILHDPDDLWHRITEITMSQWNDKRGEYSLHRFPKAHERVYRIGQDIVTQFNGDSRNIWKDRTPVAILHCLNQLRFGEQISRMVVGALDDTGQISGKCDVKVDMHVRKVLGKVLRGKEFGTDEIDVVLRETRSMHPENPWLLDNQLYQLGKNVCPNCEICYLRQECASLERHDILRTAIR